MSELLIMGIAGMGMWALRASAIVVAGDRPMPASATRTFGYAKHAVLAAMIAATVADGRSIATVAAPTPELGATLVAGVVAWRGASMLRTLAAGMATASVLAM